MTSTSSSSALSPATAHCLGDHSSPTGPSSLFEDLRSLPAIHTSLPQTHQARQKTGARFPGRSIIWSPSSLLIYPLRSSIKKEPDKLPRCSPILVSDSIFGKWPAIRQAILDRSDISEWTALECWRYGRDANSQNNPPTLIVSVQKHTAHFFHAAKQRLKTISLEFGEPDVAILFMKDGLSLCCEQTGVPITHGWWEIIHTYRTTKCFLS